MRPNPDRTIPLALALMLLVGGGIWFVLEGDGAPLASRLPAIFGGGAQVTPLDPDPGFTADLAVLTARGQTLRPAMLLPEEGRLVVVGSAAGLPGSERLAALCLRDDGRADGAFGQDGLALIDFQGGDQVARGGLIDDQGRLYLHGHGADGAVRRNMVVARLDRSGALDTTFDNDGLLALRFGDGIQSAESAALDDRGRLILAGFAEQDIAGERFREMALARLQPDGSLDPTFAGGGQRRDRIGLAEHDQAITGLAALPGGGLLAAASVASSLGDSQRRPVLAQWLPAGVLDASFGRRGLSELPVSGELLAIAPGDDGGTWAAGRTGEAGSEAFVVRVAADGRLDPTFGERGLLRLGASPGGEIRRLWLLPGGQAPLLVLQREASLDCRFLDPTAASWGGLAARSIPLPGGGDAAVAQYEGWIYVAHLPATEEAALTVRRYPLAAD